MKKAQGALEFLMTYGWAFLVILIMIGALAYFGVLSPTKFLPERCTFGSQFICKDYLIAYDDSGATPVADITVKLQNNLGQAIYVNNTITNVTSVEGFQACTIAVQDGAGVDIGADTATAAAVPDGAYFVVSATDCASLGGMTQGSKYKLNVDVIYYAATSSGAFSHTVQGELFSNVE
ncbi:MAG: hypothetical protein WC254_06860 [Candidatus Woesearchaeota archaeon]|jgi:hypothetical protein